MPQFCFFQMTSLFLTSNVSDGQSVISAEKIWHTWDHHQISNLNPPHRHLHHHHHHLLLPPPPPPPLLLPLLQLLLRATVSLRPHPPLMISQTRKLSSPWLPVQFVQRTTAFWSSIKTVLNSSGDRMLRRGKKT